MKITEAAARDANRPVGTQTCRGHNVATLLPPGGFPVNLDELRHRTCRIDLGTVSAQHPLVSVVIPVCGRSEELNRLLSSIAIADHADQLEVIVVDNPLPLNREWLQASGWPFRLAYVHVAVPNRGLSRNTGAVHATGSRLLFIDSDIVLSTTVISTMFTEIADCPGGVVMANVVFPPSQARTLGTHLYDVPAYFRRYRRQRRIGDLTFREFVSCCFIIETCNFVALGGFDNDFLWYGYEDVEFGYRTQRHGLRIGLSTARVYHHKHLDPVAILRRAQETGRSAVRLVELHPDIEEQLPLGVAETISATLPPLEDFDVNAALGRAEAIERVWARICDHGHSTSVRVLVDQARTIYRELHRHGHLEGIAAELWFRRSPSV